MFLKIGKVHHRVWGTEKLPGCFCYLTSLNLSISSPFQVSSCRKVFLENHCLWKYRFTFPATLLNYVTDIFQTLWKQWSNTCYFEEDISISATEWLTSLLGIASVRSKSLSQFLKKAEASRYRPSMWIFLEVFNY